MPDNSKANMPGENEYSDDFASDIASEIGSELFSKASPVDDGLGNGETVNEEVAAPLVAAPVVKTEPTKSSVEAPPAAIVPGVNSVSKPLPKSWKKDMAPLWEKADPALHEYVYSREADVMRGIQGYQQNAQQWQSLIQPFAPIFQQNSDVNPVQLMQGLMNTHLQLLNPSMSPEKKLAMAKSILSDYGIDFGETGMQSADPRILDLQTRLDNQERQNRAREQAAYQSGVDEQAKVVETFASDPKNKYFTEVGNDIFRFIQTGAANDLQSAYDLACYANPAVRAKMLADQQVITPPVVPANRAKNGQFVNVEGIEPVPRTRKGSIDSTIDGIISAAYAKSH